MLPMPTKIFEWKMNSVYKSIAGGFIDSICFISKNENDTFFEIVQTINKKRNNTNGQTIHRSDNSQITDMEIMMIVHL
jgi:hypothetical protein